MSDLLLVSEVLIIVVSAVSTELFYSLLSPDFLLTNSYVIPGLACAFLYAQVARGRGLMSPHAVTRGLANWRAVLIAFGLSLLLLCGCAFALKISSNYSRGWIAIWAAQSSVLLLIGRWLFARGHRALSRSGRLSRRIFVISASGSASALRDVRDAEGVRIAGEMPLEPADLELEESASVRLLMARLAGASDTDIDEIVIDVDGFNIGQLQRLSAIVSELSIPIWFHVSRAEIGRRFEGIDRIGAFNVIKVQSHPIEGWSYCAKRAFDILVSGLAILIAAPLLLLIATAIRLESPGPAIFRQRRNGLDGREITVLKFRTMTVMEDGQNVVQATRTDQRVTRVGRLLRRSSFDELPQLFNVLNGEMSIVGPRPHALAHNEHYRRLVARYGARHRMKPGITGLAQICGLRGKIDSPEMMEARVRKDLEYIEHWSLWLDLKILVLTPIYGFFHPNAY